VYANGQKFAAPARRLLGLGDRPRGVDEADVAEGLREVAERSPVAGSTLLGQQPTSLT
jgi:hypothetical protein